MPNDSPGSRGTERPDAPPSIPTDLEGAKKRFQRLLFGVLAVLGRQGFAVTFQEGVDMVHDFFLDQWSGVASRYDPDLGPINRYVAEAFRKYARRRILRLQKWRTSLRDTRNLEYLPTSPEKNADPADRELLALAEKALETLPDPPRKILRLRLDGVSERAIADELGLTRYRVRERLAEAFGRFIIGMGQKDVFSTQEWRLAEAMWRDGCTRAQATGRVGCELQQVHALCERVLSMLTRAAPVLRRSSRSGNES